MIVSKLKSKLIHVTCSKPLLVPDELVSLQVPRVPDGMSLSDHEWVQITLVDSFHGCGSQCHNLIVHYGNRSSALVHDTHFQENHQGISSSICQLTFDDSLPNGMCLLENCEALHECLVWRIS